MTVTFLVLFVVGLGMLVRGLITVSKARAAWMARSIAATANVIACREVRNPQIEQLENFAVTVEFTDTRGMSRTAELPASERMAPGDLIDIRFDPNHPASVYQSERFAGSNLPAALIVFGGLLMIVSFVYVTG